MTANARLLFSTVLCAAGLLAALSAPAADSVPAAGSASVPAPSPGGVVETVAPASSTSGPPSTELDDNHKLAIGDRLSFRIVEDEEDPKSLFVTDTGQIEVPYIGRFLAEGKTCLQLSRELKAKLEEEYYHQATVILAVDVMAKTRGRVYLIGPVRAGGPQDIPTDETFTLSKAILRAGGFTDYADSKKVRVTRRSTPPGKEDKVFIVDVQQVLEKGKAELDMVLEPGDFVYIPEKGIRF